MALEIERKFLVSGNQWKKLVATTQHIKQGYLNDVRNHAASVRVRLIDNQAWLSVKSATPGISRNEFEYPISSQDANYMLTNLCQKRTIEKLRHHLKYQGNDWVVDEFIDHNRPLLLAEIELSEVEQKISLPEWVGEEVTDNLYYYNTSLVKTV